MAPSLDSSAVRPGALTVHRRMRRVRGLLARHWPFVLILAAGTVVRGASEVAYHPALFFPDSWEYLDLALRHPFVGFEVDRPSGYPFFVWLFTLDNRSLILLTAVQHLAGLATAVFVYAIGLRLALGRWVAAAVAALVALDGAVIALEQFVMTEPLFTLCIVGATYAVISNPRSQSRWLVSGVLLAVAILMRTSGVFFVPVWLLYLICKRPGWRPALAAVAAVALPVLAYGALHAADGRGFGLSQTNGWFLYARVAPIARCTSTWPTRADLRAVCPTPSQQADDWSPGDYMWDNPSPANRAFGSMYTGNVAHSSAVLGTFARQVLTRRPGAYLNMIAGDAVAMFDPTRNTWESAVEFPAPGQTDWVDPVVKREDQQNYHRRIDPPQAQLRAYWQVLHTPRLPLAILSAAGLLSLLGAVVSRRWRAVSMPAETLLMTGGGLALLVGTIASSDAIIRYLLPAEPLLGLGGALALVSAARLIAPRARTLVARGRSSTTGAKEQLGRA
jgi:Dolichyl-phosphate-mannose-protein mannosyltransferase